MSIPASPPIRRALLSVSNKTQIIPFAQKLHQLNIEIISTGGTAALLRQAGLPVTDVCAVTGSPEMFDGRVKTLHPSIHAGILARDSDQATLQTMNLAAIELVVVNCYPFNTVVSDPDCSLEQAIEHIDIGGPTMIRAAAKNHQRVTVVIDNTDFKAVLNEIQQHGHTEPQTRAQLALKAFQHTARYDQAIAEFLSRQHQTQEPSWPSQFNPLYELHQPLRYGENPHQQAAVYRDTTDRADSLIQAHQWQGKPLSYNNYADADAAIKLCQEFSNACACVIVKHANPCGVALGKTPREAYQRAFNADPDSSFGGIIAINQAVTADVIETILKQQFVEVIVALEFDAGAQQALKQKPNVRAIALQSFSPSQSPNSFELKKIIGGLLLQSHPHQQVTETWECVTQAKLDEVMQQEVQFAWSIVKHVKSNAIVLSSNHQTIGIGAGQASRITSTEIALNKAQQYQFNTQGAVLASDAFFPFRDSIDRAAQAGIKAIIQPGGSIRDEEIIAAANEHGIAMVFTGCRFFSH